MNICDKKNPTPINHELIPGHIYTCTIDNDLRFCACNHDKQMKIYNLQTGVITNGSPPESDGQYTDVTDDWCLEKVKS